MTLEELYRLLRSSHVQTQGIVDTLQEPLVVLDKGFVIINANPAFYRVFDTDHDSTMGQSLFDLGNGQWDIPELRRLLSEVVPKAAAIVGYEVTHDFPGIGQRVMRVSARQLRHPDNNSTQMLVVFDDVTQRQKDDATKDILVAETRHRMKNLIAMVKAIVRQTEAAGLSGEQYRDTITGRIDAVLNAQEFVSASEDGVDLGAIVEQCLQPIAGGRAEVMAGPALTLNAYQVMPATMILHELATNAVKYGALSSADGVIRVGWKTEPREGAKHLVLSWSEQGGPPVLPPNRRGFGTRLIDFSAKAEGGSVAFDFAPTGLQVEITLPLAG